MTYCIVNGIYLANWYHSAVLYNYIFTISTYIIVRYGMYVCAMYNRLLSSKSSKMSSHSHGMLAERGGMPELVAERGQHEIALIPHYLL